MGVPQCIELTLEAQRQLKNRVRQSGLSADDQRILLGIIDFNNWLQFALQEKKINISRLKHAFFNRSEKSTASGSSKNQEPLEQPKKEEPRRNKKSSPHPGRMKHNDYANAEKIVLLQDEFKTAQSCPEKCGGRLWHISPGNVIKITGQGFCRAIHYVQEKLRCSMCGKIISAFLPSHVSQDKYDYAFKAHLCMLKYYMGLPFYRIETYQKAVGIPLPDSTQWQLVEELADSVYPVFHALEKLAACGHLVHVDDTTVRILSAIKENKFLKNRKDRKGSFTTGVLSYYEQHQIYLFYSSRKHAGENMINVLAKRSEELPPIQYMCDALSRNMPDALKAILINCLSHARRKFVEIESFYIDECGYVINALAKVYHHDAIAKEDLLTPEQRLLFHQEHSHPIMEALYIWLKKQLVDNQVEPNSALGGAIQYFLNHWHKFNQFLKIPGAPLDNNILEATLKILIRIRKNALFFATEHSAFVGSMILSLIQTCIAAGQNPIDYLTALQVNKSQIFKEPMKWLPWNYLGSQSSQTKAAA